MLKTEHLTAYCVNHMFILSVVVVVLIGTHSPVLLAKKLVDKMVDMETMESVEKVGNTFNNLDANGDGYLSREEAYENQYLKDNFESTDRDANDRIDQEEFKLL